MKGRNQLIIIIAIMVIFRSVPLHADDSEISRSTMSGLSGIHVLVESIQPNIQKYAQKAELSTTQIKNDAERQLAASGIRTLSSEEWLKAPGRPVLYININTHETGKYWYAYDIKLELRQIVSLEINPKIKTLADTWSVNITGVANIGNLDLIKKDANILLARFIQVYRTMNKRK